MAPCPDQHADRDGAVEPLLETVVEALASLPSRCSRLWLALSGGCDSITLLHCTVQAHRRLQRQYPQRVLPSLHALHVNHQLQSAAEGFERLCRETCEAWGVTLHVERVSIDPHAGGGLESLAREARYAAFEHHLHDDDVLWMAHHADDQAETVLQRAMRGSGIAGMAGMPAQRSLGRGMLMRPLLAYSRRALEDYAQNHDIRWCDDPSNASLQYDRNYLRHDILPRLSERWPQAVTALGQVAAHARDADALLNMMADRQLAQWPDAPRQLPLDVLCNMDEREVRLIIRRALAVLRIPMPPRARLTTVLSQLTVGQGHIAWEGGEVRLWRGALYLGSNSADASVCAGETMPVGACHTWHLAPKGMDLRSPLRFASRQGGERLYVNGHHRSLKALFQALHIPPWQREQYDVVWCGEEPVALISEEHAIVADGWSALRVTASEGI